jgi:hypothetical protein
VDPEVGHCGIRLWRNFGSYGKRPLGHLKKMKNSIPYNRWTKQLLFSVTQIPIGVADMLTSKLKMPIIRK